MFKKVLFTALFLLTTQAQGREIILAEKAYVDDLATKRVRPSEMAAALANYATISYVDAATSDDYSTSEVIVGKWIDDKPIYKRTFTLAGGAAIGVIQETLDGSGAIDKLIKSEVFMVLTNQNGIGILNGYTYFSSGNETKLAYIVQPNVLKNNIIVYRNILLDGYLNQPFYITCYYTKTSD